MQTVRRGSSGAETQDIQRRLQRLGYDLGSCGVDGVFSEDTAKAVRLFRADYHLVHGDEIDEKAWAVLVDATFELGERTLYLRMPYFHGNDVRRLQRVLSSLGFNCGATDGIFGENTERALRDFQMNTAIEADGIAADSTFAAIRRLKNAWIDRI